MNSPTYIYDPTTADSLSRVRGIGRYLQILHENFQDEYIFTHELQQIPFESTFVNPFFNILAPPLITKRIAKHQIAVIHDLITVKYPHHFPIGIKGRINLFRNKRAIRHYDHIITDSEASKKDIMSILGITEENIAVIYPIVAKTFTRPDIKPLTTNDQRLTTNYCIYVGDATWNKNLVNLAHAIQIANIPCVFVGKIFANTKSLEHPWQKELREFVKITHSDARFIFPGFIPDDVLIDLYKNAVCNILVSRDEGFGFSYLEAATCGVPSVLSDILVLHETAEGSALFASPDDPGGIAKQILEFTSDKQRRNEFAVAAQKRSEFFTPHTFKANFRAVCLQS